MLKCSTEEAAERLGIARPNLQRLIRQGRVNAPEIQTVGRIKIRLWSDKDIEAAKKIIEGR